MKKENTMKWIIFVMAAALVTTEIASAQDSTVAPTFGDDLAFLKKHKDVVVLSDSSGAMQVAVVPDYQARIMTSTADGASSVVRRTSANIPGRQAPSALSRTMRATAVRVSACTCGRICSMVPCPR